MLVAPHAIKYSGSGTSTYGRLVLLLLGLSTLLGAQNVAIGSYPTPTLESQPEGITAGPDGALWFTERIKIGRITTAGAFTEYVLPTQGANAYIASGPDGALWFTQAYGFDISQIGRITTTGALSFYPLPVGSDPFRIASGPDNALWFTESGINSIGRISTAGVITQYPIPTPNSGPSGITLGSDGALWFTESTANQIGRITPGGMFTEYPLPNTGPNLIVAGPDGALWFGVSGAIGRISTSGAYSQYLLPSGKGAGSLTVGPDGALWFTGGYSTIGRMTLTGVSTFYTVDTLLQDALFDIALGPDGELWFTDMTGNSIGEVAFVTAGLTVTPSTGFFKDSLTFSGSAFAPGETVDIFSAGVGSRVIASATADSTGSFTATGAQPASVYGPRIFLGSGQSSGALGAANYSVGPRLIFSSNSAAAGSTAAIGGVGFSPIQEVAIYWDSTSKLLGKVKADGNGEVGLKFTVPSNAAPGRHLVFGNERLYTGAIQAGGFFYVVP
jgi:streptogramin lyase